jgi:hypothetical protein
MVTTFERLIWHYPAGGTAGVDIARWATAETWFELDRQGGCGAGELHLSRLWPERDAVAVGDLVAFDYRPGNRWYLGRVQDRVAVNPAGVVLSLQGLTVQLGEIFPGGFGADSPDGTPPLRIAQNDRFANDPDRDLETVVPLNRPDEVVRYLMANYVAERTGIDYRPELVANTGNRVVESLKLNGEESLRGLLKDLAMRAGNFRWGVDAAKRFFFQPTSQQVGYRYRLGESLVSLETTRSLDEIVNRVLLTGGVIYTGATPAAGEPAGSYRFRQSYLRQTSRQTYGDRRRTLSLPWIRTTADALAFARQYLDEYAEPTDRLEAEVLASEQIPIPGAGLVEIADQSQRVMGRWTLEAVRVEFRGVPRIRLSLGRLPPETLWPEAPYAERFPIAAADDDDLSSSDTSESSVVLSSGPGNETWVGGGGGGNSSNGLTSSQVTSSLITSSDVSDLPTSLDQTSSEESSSGTSDEVVSSEAESSDDISWLSSDSGSSMTFSSQPTSTGTSSMAVSSEVGSSYWSWLSSDRATSTLSSSLGSSGLSSSGSTSSDVGSSGATSNGSGLSSMDGTSNVTGSTFSWGTSLGGGSSGGSDSDASDSDLTSTFDWGTSSDFDGSSS